MAERLRVVGIGGVGTDARVGTAAAAAGAADDEIVAVVAHLEAVDGESALAHEGAHGSGALLEALGAVFNQDGVVRAVGGHAEHDGSSATVDYTQAVDQTVAYLHTVDVIVEVAVAQSYESGGGGVGNGGKEVAGLEVVGVAGGEGGEGGGVVAAAHESEGDVGVVAVETDGDLLAGQTVEFGAYHVAGALVAQGVDVDVIAAYRGGCVDQGERVKHCVVAVPSDAPVVDGDGAVGRDGM